MCEATWEDISPMEGEGYFTKLIAGEFLDEWNDNYFKHKWWKGWTHISRKCPEYAIFCWWTYEIIIPE